jgi:hypothetical protein
VREIEKVKQHKMQLCADSSTRPSRREMLKTAATLAAGYTALGPLHALAQGKAVRKKLVYAGTYNSPVDGGAGNGKGIYLFELNSISGELTLIKLAAEARNPSWLSQPV